MSEIGKRLDSIIPGYYDKDSILIREIPQYVTVVLAHSGNSIYVSAVKGFVLDIRNNTINCFDDICDRCHSKDTQLGTFIEHRLGSFVDLFFKNPLDSLEILLSGFIEIFMRAGKVCLGFFANSGKEFKENFPAKFEIHCPNICKDSLELYRRVNLINLQITCGEDRKNLNKTKVL